MQYPKDKHYEDFRKRQAELAAAAKTPEAREQAAEEAAQFRAWWRYRLEDPEYQAIAKVENEERLARMTTEWNQEAEKLAAVLQLSAS